MALVVALSAFDMGSTQTFVGTLEQMTPTSITVTYGPQTSVYLGNFTFEELGSLSGVQGTLTGYQEFIGSKLVFTASDVSVDASLTMEFLAQGKIEQVNALMLSGNDRITGSLENDKLAGFGGDDTLAGSAGNDTFRGGGGNDALDGGAGFNEALYLQASKNFSLTIADGRLIVEDRSSVEGTDTLTNIQRIEFADGFQLNTDWMLQAPRLGEAEFQNLIELYIGYFDRAPDALGLAYWANRMIEGMSIVDIARSFSVQPETLSAYPSTLSTSEFVTKIYENVLERAPDDAGLAYWVNDINSGSQTRDKFVLSLINGAHASTGSPTDARYLANKEAVGEHFARWSGLNDVEWAKQVLANVDSSTASVETAKLMVDKFALAAITTDPHLLTPLVGIGHEDT